MTVTDWQVISSSDLEDERSSGGFIRCRCHLHGGDHQRSLSINEANGFGTCHACGAQVLVKEFNSEAAANIERSQGRIANGEIRVKDPRFIKLTPKKVAAPPPIEKWQRDELTLLRSLYDSMTSRLDDERASAYIKGRGLKLETAQALGLGYIPDKQYSGKYALLARWSDCIVIPCHSPEHGLQFAGRSLKLWQPGMDENEHKDLLEKDGIKRWRKTHATGWLNFKALETAAHVTIVEGPFDALACIEAGLNDVVAVIGTAVDVAWLPKSLRSVTLALDGDESGREKAAKARDAIYVRGYDVQVSCPPDDDMGKDWSERYRLYGAVGLADLLCDDLHCGCGADVEHYSPDGVPYCDDCWRDIYDEERYNKYMYDLRTAPDREDETPAPVTQEQAGEQARALVESVFGPCEMRVFRPGEFTLAMRVAEIQQEERELERQRLVKDRYKNSIL